MKRTLIRDCVSSGGQEIKLKGWVDTKRDHGKLTFIDLRDRTGIVQCVGFQKMSELTVESSVEIVGLVKMRPEKMINPALATGTVEIDVKEYKILGQSEALPFDMGQQTLHVELPTLLDHRSLTLKHKKIQMIFKIQAAIAQAFRDAARELDCTEIFIPTIAAGATEGGADVFSVDYYGHKAYMTQSPQLYKQIMVGVLERVFVITKAYRAEPSVTTRHLSEVTMMDVEMAFIDTFEDLLDAVEFVGTSMIKHVATQHVDILKAFVVDIPLIPIKVPRLKLRDAQKIITERTGRDLSNELDMNPEDEKEICLWAKENHKSDFVTITHYPTRKRAFYTYPDPEEPAFSLSYDLLFRGREILSGSRRINDHDQLIAAMKNKDINPDNFRMYLMAFKYGMPPEGGFSFGLERLTMQLLQLHNVREASLFPRDMERVDERLSILFPKLDEKK